MTDRTVPPYILFLVAACHAPKTPDPVITPPDAAAMPVRTMADASVDSAKPVEPKSATSTACVAPALQPGTCVPPEGEMGEGAFLAWLKARGSTEDPNFETCTGAFGGDALVCTRRGGAVMDLSLGIAGPVEFRRELVVATVRAKKRVDLLVLPLDFGVGDEVTFTGRFTVGPGVLDFALGPNECSDAKKALGDWIADQIKLLEDNGGIDPAFKKALVTATKKEKVSDEQRIVEICKALGRYEMKDGKMIKN